MEVINFTTNHVLAKATEDDGFTWFLTSFYGWWAIQEQEKSWKLLAHLRTFVDEPWLCIDDFNAFIHALKKLSKRPPQIVQVDAFQDVLELCQLEDWALGVIPSPGVIRDLVMPIRRCGLIKLLQ